MTHWGRAKSHTGQESGQIGQEFENFADAGRSLPLSGEFWGRLTYLCPCGSGRRFQTLLPGRAGCIKAPARDDDWRGEET
jgi:hypothetical protein